MGFLYFIFTFTFLLLLLFLTFVSFLIFKIFTGKSLRDPNYPPIKGTVFHQLLYFTTLYDQSNITKNKR
ncbi:hypothetical protein ABKV19_023069 [Rosa sericea]